MYYLCIAKTFMRKTFLNKAISRRVLAAAYRGTAETLFSNGVFFVFRYLDRIRHIFMRILKVL